MSVGVLSRSRLQRLAPYLGAALVALPTPGLTEEQERTERRTVIFGSLEAGHSSFASVGFKRAIDSLDRSGFVALGSFGYGGEPVRSTLPTGERETRYRHKGLAAGLVGYQWVTDGLVVAGLVGPEYDFERDPGTVHDRSHRRPGLRVQGEVWAHPTVDTLVTVTGILGSAREHAWLRGSAGYKVWREVFLGPEATFYGTDDYREWRLGLHATGLTFGRYTLRLSAGWSRIEEGRSGPYAGVTGHVRW